MKSQICLRVVFLSAAVIDLQGLSMIAELLGDAPHLDFVVLKGTCIFNIGRLGSVLGK